MNHYLNGQYFVIALFVVLFAAAGYVSTYFETPQAHAQTLSESEKAKLRAEYDQVQKEIEQWQKVLDDTRAKKNTLQGDVTALTAQINKAQAEIKQRNGTITRLAGEINEKSARIKTLEERLEQGRESLAKLMRDKNENESQPLMTLALTSQDLSDFFSNVDSIDAINRQLQELFVELRGVKDETEKEKLALSERKNQELDAKYEVEVKKQEIDQHKQEKNQLLTVTKQDETAYQQILAERQRKAAEIHARLFPLRDTEAIKFGDAVTYAKVASSKTGVRSVFILAILSQESALGANVGNCLVTDLSTGNGKGKNTGTPFANVMKAPRDTVPFERITSALGKDWRLTPVSCPQAAGYGGAMGPTQFIPSTWELFDPRIKAVLGIPATNPWNAGHAIMATGLFLMDGGAAAQTYTAERNAACRYFSGRLCPGTGGWIDSYANSVVVKANAYQKDVDALADL
ncbi:MAG: hypothetical protein AAB449_00845 [Patescibacteria group bacterium]